MALRRPAYTELEDPPAGAVRIAFWRPIGATHNEMVQLHRDNGALVKESVQAAGLDVRSWGNTDAEHPSEVIEILVAAFAGAVATKLVDYLAKRISYYRKKDRTGLLAITARRDDGAQLVWEEGVTKAQAKAVFADFAAGKDVPSILGGPY